MPIHYPDEIEVYARIVAIREEEWHYQSTKVFLKIQVLEVEHIGYEKRLQVEIGDFLDATIFESELGSIERGDLIRAHLKKVVNSLPESEWSIVSYKRFFNLDHILYGYLTLNIVICIYLAVRIEITRWRNNKIEAEHYT
jgi:hypothetical protein